MKSVAAVAVVAAVLAACSVPGEPVREVDLAVKAAPSDAFQYGPGLSVPATSVLTDVTLRPQRAENNPRECTPAPVDPSTAQARVGPGGPAGGTLTAVVVRASDTFDEFVAQVKRCAEFTLGGTVGTTVSTRVDAEEPAGTIAMERRLLMGPQSPESTPPTTSITEFVAQQGDIRVYVQNRRSGEAALGAEELEATRKLFAAAQASAFAS
ncbi:MAG: hypothetical protein GX543_17050 [Gordonia sp.]|nr:hypothetical protein [Gordonia sp. (in: high G+C Gram-positive bacteria)]